MIERRAFLKSGLVVAAAARVALPSDEVKQDPSATIPEQESCDTFVYGSTPGGIAAAIEAARRGDRVLLACPKKNPGGMAASGLSTTDAVRRHLFGGLMIEFISNVRRQYERVLADDKNEWKLTKDGW